MKALLAGPITYRKLLSSLMLGLTNLMLVQSPAVEFSRGLQLPWQLSGLLEDAPHDMELNRSMLGTGEGGVIASCLLPARKEAALAVIDCSIVTEAPDRDGRPSRGLSGACGTR